MMKLVARRVDPIHGGTRDRVPGPKRSLMANPSRWGFHAFFRQYYNLRGLLRRVDPGLHGLLPLLESGMGKLRLVYFAVEHQRPLVGELPG